MVPAIPFPSPVMRIDPATHALIVAQRDADTGEISSQTPNEGTLQRDRDARVAAAQGAPPPTVAATPAAVKAVAAPSAPAPVITTIATAVPDAEGHVSVFV